MKPLLILTIILSLISCASRPIAVASATTDPVAERMLLFQRDNGGWPQYHGDRTDYREPLTEEMKATILADKQELDATIDDHTTTTEIAYLIKAYAATDNENYLKAAERGISYLLAAQYPSGGWPQEYPDPSSYHAHITFNDNAMVDVMTVMQDVSEHEGDYGAISDELRREAKAAYDRGIDCILRLQVKRKGQLTAWGAQHDAKTLAPAPARKFEPASLSGSESVGIVLLLMKIDNPDARVRSAIEAAVLWFEEVKIEGYDYKEIKAPDQPSGRDRIIVEDPESTIWARFYELETMRPIFIGRDAVIRYALEEIDNERRVGYGFYGTWPEKIIEKAYPAWKERLGE